VKKAIGLGLALFAIVSCKNKNQFTIEGKLENAGDLKQVLLYKEDLLIDSAVLSEDKEFKFNVASPDATFFYVVAKDKNYLLVAQNGDDLDFHADFTNQTGEYSIEGSDIADKLKSYNQISNRYGKVFLGLQNQFQKEVSKNPAVKDSLEKVLLPVFEKNMEEFGQASLKFGQENKDNLAGFYAMSSLDVSKYEPQLLDYAGEIRGKFLNNKPVEAFLSRMDKIKAVAIGQIAPDFEAPTLIGGKMKLSDLRGKYVLLDFWASWCAPCRQENPNIVRIHNTYKNKNFTVLGVSLDNTKADWEKAVKADNLAWNHVSELMQWDSKIARDYQVESIPSSFLLDPQGKIIAKNLRGSDLEVFLKKTLK